MNTISVQANEYVIYKTQQQRMRYLVEFRLPQDQKNEDKIEEICDEEEEEQTDEQENKLIQTDGIDS